MKLIAEQIVKRFGTHLILRNINFEVRSGSSLVITGANGSGKTTLVKILSNLIAPTRGRVIYQNEKGSIPRDHMYRFIGLVGPYLQLYQELTAQENLVFFARMREVSDYENRIAFLMERLGLKGREKDPVKAYSSGMQQRLKYVCALLHEPEILFIDEPRSNLDQQGVDTVYEILSEQKKDKILVVATNDREDLRLADQIIKVGKE
ncbi:MAG: ABC transporter ATP-binding protein [Calditrichaeota bacterium]|nr:ABC transporter ATP-binding protein [Calditrichota bacterium]